MAHSGCPPRALCLPEGTCLGHTHAPHVFTEPPVLALCPPLGSKMKKSQTCRRAQLTAGWGHSVVSQCSRAMGRIKASHCKLCVRQRKGVLKVSNASDEVLVLGDGCLGTAGPSPPHPALSGPLWLLAHHSDDPARTSVGIWPKTTPTLSSPPSCFSHFCPAPLLSFYQNFFSPHTFKGLHTHPREIAHSQLHFFSVVLLSLQNKVLVPAY